MARPRYNAQEQARIDAGECIDGCGSRDIPPVKVGARWQIRRCKQCREQNCQAQKLRLEATGCKICKRRKHLPGKTHCFKCTDKAALLAQEAATTPAPAMVLLSQKERREICAALSKVQQRPDAERVLALARKIEQRHWRGVTQANSTTASIARVVLESLDVAIKEIDQPGTAPVLLAEFDRHNVRRFDQYVSPIDA